MLADVDFCLRREQVAEDRTWIHRGMDLLTVGDHRVAGERIVVLPACQLADAAGLAVDGAQSGAVTLTPDHSLVIGRADLAASLDQRTVRVKQQLRVVDRPAVALVDTDGRDHSRLFLHASPIASTAGGEIVTACSSSSRCWRPEMIW